MKKIILLLSISATFFFGKSQQTVGLFLNTPESYNGYTFFAPMPYTSTYLIDNCGYLIHTWESTYKPGLVAYLLPDGSILRTGQLSSGSFGAGGYGGIIERIDWDSNVIWSYQISDTSQCQHHDIEYLPNGNVLAIVWEKATVAEVIQAGRNPANIGTSFWYDKIIEIEPSGSTGGNIVWEWHAKDHLIQDFDSTKDNYGIVTDHPELIDINFLTSSSQDWLHLNSVDYNPQLDEILISCHNMSEVWIIDHSTTTAEAADHSGGNSGKGGDLLYRWGNPEAYDRGTSNDKQFFGQHNAHWIESGNPDEGKIMVFNNGANRTPSYSSIDIIAPPLDSSNNYTINSGQPYGPDTIYWTYTADNPTDFYSSGISGAQRLPNGNTLICDGKSADFFEVTLTGNTVWEYVSPVSTNGPIAQETTTAANNVFRATRFSPDYSAFNGHTLTPGNPIELNPYNYTCDIYTGNKSINDNSYLKVYPNPATNTIIVNQGKK